MPHILAKITGVKPEILRPILERDAPIHAIEGNYLEKIWQDVDNSDVAYFLFRTDDLAHARIYIESTHRKAQMENPDINLPEMVYLEER